MRYAPSVLLLFLVSSAQAAPVTWVVDATFTPAFCTFGTVTGTFDYEAETRTYTNVNLQSTSEDCDRYLTSTFTVEEHESYTGDLWAEGHSKAPGYTTVIHLDFAAPLTSAGGEIAIASSSSQILTCTEFEGNPCRPLMGNALSGSVSTVPVPAALWLFMSGLALLGFARKKHA